MKEKVTSYVDENGKEINPSDKGTKDKKDIPEYTFKETKKDKYGNTIHVYTKKSSSTPYSPTPSTPSNEESKSTFVDGKRELPNTGTQSSTSSLLLGALAAITGLGLVSRRRKDDKE